MKTWSTLGNVKGAARPKCSSRQEIVGGGCRPTSEASSWFYVHASTPRPGLDWGFLGDISISSCHVSAGPVSYICVLYMYSDYPILYRRSSTSQSPFSTTSHSGMPSSLANFFFSLSASFIGAGSLNERTNWVPAALPRKLWDVPWE